MVHQENVLWGIKCLLTKALDCRYDAVTAQIKQLSLSTTDKQVSKQDGLKTVLN